MPLERVRRGSALTRNEFHQRLRSWLGDTEDPIVGLEEVPGVTPWVYIRDGSSLFELHADTKREAVRGYLELVALHGDDLRWEVTASERGNMTAVAYGPERVRNKSFYLYAAKAAA